MATDALDRLERLFRAARLHPPDERAAFLDAACDDEALRAEVESLLAADAEADDGAFLQDSAAALLGAVAEAPVDALAGRQVGPYRVLRPLGEGGMGAVYLAVREAPFLRHVALKVVRGGLATPEAVRRFEQERQILASLDHPGIAQLLDGGVTEAEPGAPAGLPYFALEYVEGLPITAYCDEHRLGVDARLDLFCRVCDTVHSAHQNLVLHRDLKPSNILVTASGGPDGGPQVKLLDFGIAKLLNPNLRGGPMPVTRRALRVLTPEYAAPEQVRGEPLSTASDVYSLGVVLYELLAGRRPYRLTRGSADEIVRAVVEAEPERPSTAAGRTEAASPEAGRPITAQTVAENRDLSPARLRRTLRGDLDTIVMMALRKEPARRYASAEALAQDLRRYRRGLPVHARRTSRGYRLGKLVRRHKAETALVVVVLATVIGVAVVSQAQARRIEAERDRTAQALRQSEEVTDFLVNLFAASDPEEAQGDTLTATMLLDRGLDRAEALAGEPTVQARMLETIADVYGSLGRYDESTALLQRVLALRRSTFGDEDEAVARTMVALADAMTSQGRYHDADALAGRALAVQRRVLGPRHAETAATLSQLSGLAVYLGDLDGAVSYARDALAVREAALGPDDPLVGQSWSLLGRTVRRQGDMGEALFAFRRAAAIAQAHYGPEHPDVANALLQVAYTLGGTDRLDEAESLTRRALAIRRRTLGAGHPLVAHATGDLAEILTRRGRHEEALALHRERIALLTAALGPEHPHVYRSTGVMADALAEAGRLDEAEATLRDVVARTRQVRGPDHPAVVGAVSSLASVLARQGRDAEAEALYREGLALAEAAHGPQSPDAARLQAALAGTITRQGRYAEAEALLLQALTSFREGGVAERHGQVQAVLVLLAETYAAWGRPAESARYEARLIGARPSTDGPSRRRREGQGAL